MEYQNKEDIIEVAFDKAKDLVIPSEKNNFKSAILESNVLLCFVALVLFLKIFTVLISINIPQNIFFADITRFALENSINQTRQIMGLKPLSVNEKLNQAAQLKAENMLENNYFNHTSPTGVTPWFWFLKAGYTYKYAGENLAIGFYDSQEVYDAWLNSPSHKANIVNPNYTEVGTAVLKGFGPNNTIVVVQEFASPMPAKQVLAKNTAPKPVLSQAKVQPIQPKTEAAAPVEIASEKVLSQSTQANSLLESTGMGTSNLKAKIMNFTLYNYENVLQDLVYGTSLLVIGILMILILFSFNISVRKNLVIRAVLMVVLLSIAGLANKEILVSFIPHQIII